jgi:hypothetical protein
MILLLTGCAGMSDTQQRALTGIGSAPRAARDWCDCRQCGFGRGHDPAIKVSNLTTITASTFGGFDCGIVCTDPTGCGHGSSNPNSGPLIFFDG